MFDICCSNTNVVLCCLDTMIVVSCYFGIEDHGLICFSAFILS